jgi:hypothetical protein
LSLKHIQSFTWEVSSSSWAASWVSSANIESQRSGSARTIIMQTQCQRLPHEWGLGKGITEAKSYPRRNSAERRLRTQDLVTQRASTHQLHQACPSRTDNYNNISNSQLPKTYKHITKLTRCVSLMHCKWSYTNKIYLLK